MSEDVQQVKHDLVLVNKYFHILSMTLLIAKCSVLKIKAIARTWHIEDPGQVNVSLGNKCLRTW